MKIRNVSSQELRLPMKKSNGQKLFVTLLPGQFVYSEADNKQENKQLIIWERKQAIEITDDEKPKTLDYCHPYSILPKSTIAPTIILVEEEDDDDVDEVIKQAEKVKSASIKNFDEEFNEVDDDDDDDTAYKDDDDDDESSDNCDEPETNNANPGVTTIVDSGLTKDGRRKGGRPKGVKNKKKRGRPKNNKLPKKNATLLPDTTITNLEPDAI